LSTTAMSNLGKPFSHSSFLDEHGLINLGDATLTLIEAMPAGRTYLPLGFTVNGYSGKLTVTLSYNPKVISCQQAKTLAEAFSEQILGNSNHTH